MNQPFFRAGVILLYVAACLPFTVSAQVRANLPWWNSPVINDIGLTPEQQGKIRQIVKSYRSRLLDARNNAHKAEGDLDDAFNDPEVDVKGAGSVISKVAETRAESSRVFLEMSLQLRSVLTLDQWRTLVRRWDEVKNKRPNDTQVPP